MTALATLAPPAPRPVSSRTLERSNPELLERQQRFIIKMVEEVLAVSVVHAWGAILHTHGIGTDGVGLISGLRMQAVKVAAFKELEWAPWLRQADYMMCPGALPIHERYPSDVGFIDDSPKNYTGQIENHYAQWFDLASIVIGENGELLLPAQIHERLQQLSGDTSIIEWVSALLANYPRKSRGVLLSGAPIAGKSTLVGDLVAADDTPVAVGMPDHHKVTLSATTRDPINPSDQEGAQGLNPILMPWMSPEQMNDFGDILYESSPQFTRLVIYSIHNLTRDASINSGEYYLKALEKVPFVTTGHLIQTIAYIFAAAGISPEDLAATGIPSLLAIFPWQPEGIVFLDPVEEVYPGWYRNCVEADDIDRRMAALETRPESVKLMQALCDMVGVPYIDKSDYDGDLAAARADVSSLISPEYAGASPVVAVFASIRAQIDNLTRRAEAAKLDIRAYYIRKKGYGFLDPLPPGAISEGLEDLDNYQHFFQQIMGLRPDLLVQALQKDKQMRKLFKKIVKKTIAYMINVAHQLTLVLDQEQALELTDMIDLLEDLMRCYGRGKFPIRQLSPDVLAQFASVYEHLGYSNNKFSSDPQLLAGFEIVTKALIPMMGTAINNILPEIYSDPQPVEG